MKRQPPTLITRFFASFFRKVYAKIFGLHKEPGDHPCWQCALYNGEKGVCMIVVDRGKYAPRDEKGFRMTELRRVWPFDFCVRFLDKELGRIVVFDPDAPEHRVGKEEMSRFEEAEKRQRSQDPDEDQRLLSVVSKMGGKKKAPVSVSNRETGTRGDPWLSTNAESADGQPPTKRN